MKIGLFCATAVGINIAKLVRDAALPIACGVYNAKASSDEIQILKETWQGTPTLSSDEPVPALDLIILAWWPYLLSDEVRKSPRLGCLNFHPSLLPHNRGKNPNFWSIVEQRPFGVSIHWLGDKIDAGPVAFQRELPVSWEDTGGSLHARSREAIVELFAENMHKIWSGELPRKPQELGDGSFHLARELDPASRIDLDKSYTGRELLNLIRARTYPPYPSAWFEDGDRYEVQISIRKTST